MNRKVVVMLLGVFSLIICFSFSAEEKDKGWLRSLIERTSPHGFKSASLLPGRRGPQGSQELSTIAIHNINAHLQEVARLQNQGLSESEIQAVFSAKITSAGTGRITGKITEKGGGKIQSYASVYAYNKFGRYCGYDSVFSNSNPQYRIGNLAPGKYYIRVQSSYYQDKYYRNTTDWKKAKLVHVSKNKTTHNIHVKLDSYKGKSSIAGQVRRKDKTPMMNCGVLLYDLERGFIKSAMTDANGRYIAEKLPAGDFRLCCQYKEGNFYMRNWYGNTHNYEDAAVVSLAESQDISGIDFILEYCGSIEGKVIGSNGRPVKDRRCHITAYDMNQNSIKHGDTDEKGLFELPALHKGKYKLQITYYGRDNNLGCWYRNAKKFKSAPAVTVIPLQKKKVTVRLKPGGMITGKVVDFNGQPVDQNCRIEVYDNFYSYVKDTYPDQDGFFRIAGLEAGRYKVFADCQYCTSSQGLKPASEWYGGKYFFHEAPFVRVNVPKTTPNIHFSLEKGGSITGTLLNRQGYPLGYEGNVSVYNKMFEYVGGADYYGYYGRYEINGLPSGEYKLRAYYYGDEDFMAEWYDDRQNFETARKVSVTAPNTTGNIDFVLDYQGIIQGFVTDRNKNRLFCDDHLIRLIAYDAQTGEYVDLSDTNFVGGYQLQFLRGTYKIGAISYSGNWQPNSGDYVYAYHPDGKSFGDPNTRTFSVSPQSSKEIKPLALNRTKRSISGTIYNLHSGLPVTSGVYAVLVYDASGYWAGHSGYNDCYGSISGEYRVGGLRPGQYYVLAFAMDEGIGYHNMPAQWYGGVELTLDEKMNLAPKMNIPAGALTVAVGTGTTKGIDFYLNLSKQK